MIRTLDATALNRIANDDSVRPFIGDGGPVDLTPLVSDPLNVALTTEDGDGGYILHKLAPGLYEAHSLALPSARGRPMVRLMREGFRYLFTATDALEVVTKVPATNEAADGLARIAGFREVFRRHGAWVDGSAISYRSLGYLDWALSDARCLREGREFHDVLHAATGHYNHPEDDAHDHMVGVTMLGVRAGNHIKAIGLYNRWAVFAGYAPVRIVSETPLVIDVIDAIVELRDSRLVVLTVRRDS